MFDSIHFLQTFTVCYFDMSDVIVSYENSLILLRCSKSFCQRWKVNFCNLLWLLQSECVSIFFEIFGISPEVSWAGYTVSKFFIFFFIGPNFKLVMANDRYKDSPERFFFLHLNHTLCFRADIIAIPYPK